MIPSVKLSFAVVLSFLLCGCAYRWGYRDNKLAGGYEQLAIPVFKNHSLEPGIEIYFTNALISQFTRSKVATVVDPSQAPVTMQGLIKEVRYEGGALVEPSADNKLPRSTVLNTQYTVHVRVYLKLVRNSDNSVIWESEFNNDKLYVAPHLGSPGINSTNALYNQSVRDSTIAKLADDMMTEAHDRATENF